MFALSKRSYRVLNLQYLGMKSAFIEAFFKTVLKTGRFLSSVLTICELNCSQWSRASGLIMGSEV